MNPYDKSFSHNMSLIRANLDSAYLAMRRLPDVALYDDKCELMEEIRNLLDMVERYAEDMENINECI